MNARYLRRTIADEAMEEAQSGTTDSDPFKHILSGGTEQSHRETRTHSDSGNHLALVDAAKLVPGTQVVPETEEKNVREGKCKTQEPTNDDDLEDSDESEETSDEDSKRDEEGPPKNAPVSSSERRNVGSRVHPQHGEKTLHNSQSLNRLMRRWEEHAKSSRRGGGSRLHGRGDNHDAGGDDEDDDDHQAACHRCNPQVGRGQQPTP